jgi:uncharacterized protein YfiM (DUF2279 family)
VEPKHTLRLHLSNVRAWSVFPRSDATDVEQVWSPQARAQHFIGVDQRDAAGSSDFPTAGNAKSVHDDRSAKAKRLRTRVVPLIAAA